MHKKSTFCKVQASNKKDAETNKIVLLYIYYNQLWVFRLTTMKDFDKILVYVRRPARKIGEKDSFAN